MEKRANKKFQLFKWFTMGLIIIDGLFLDGQGLALALLALLGLWVAGSISDRMRKQTAEEYYSNTCFNHSKTTEGE